MTANTEIRQHVKIVYNGWNGLTVCRTIQRYTIRYIKQCTKGNINIQSESIY